MINERKVFKLYGNMGQHLATLTERSEAGAKDAYAADNKEAQEVSRIEQAGTVPFDLFRIFA